MSIIRNGSYDRYTVIPEAITRDSRLGIKARGLLLTMLSLPDGWDFSISGLSKILLDDGATTIRNALDALESCGYLRRTYERDESGRYVDCVWEVFDEPQEKPVVENLIAGSAIAENQTQSTTKESTTKESTTKGSVRAHAFSAPGVEDVRAYADERGIAGFDAERFVDYYAAQGWKLSNGNRMRDWKAAVRNWARRDEQELEKSGEDDPFAQYRDMEARGLI